MSDKKKLLVTASTFPRWDGDTEPRFVLDLCKYMTDEWDVTVLVPAAPGAAKIEDLEGVHVERYHYFPIHKWETLCYPGAIVPRIKEKKIRILLVPGLFISLWFQLLCKAKKYDLVHAHWIIPQGIVQSFFNYKYVVTGHGGDVTSMNSGIMKILKRRCLRKAAAVTAVSEHLRDVEMNIADGIESSIISMGVDTEKFGEQYRRDNFWGQKDKKVVLFVGRLAEKKGVKYLIEAMSDIDAMLYIVGDGPLRQELEELAKKSSNNNIVFAGNKNHEQLKEIYASADIFAAPSVTASDGDQEGLPTTILEAMASGLPVVATRHSGIQYIIEHGENGLLSDERSVDQLADNIRLILEDDELRGRLVGGAQETVKEYDYKVKAAKYMKVFEEVLAE